MNSECFFVYGTLKRGECREACWPSEPVAVQVGYIRGALVDLRDYPGLVAGDGWVRGELWQIEPSEVAATLRVLDAIEGFEPRGSDNLYERRVVEVFQSVGDAKPMATAFTYWLNDRVVNRAADRMPCRAGQGFVEWAAEATS